jgi:4-oxalocrotonate tautomerase
MPIIQITLIQGREAAAVSECAREVARTVHRSLGAPMESIRVLVNEIPASHWAIGDRTRDEVDAARSLVKEGAP